MAKSSDIRAGKAYIELGVKSTVKRQLDEIHAKLKTFGETMTSIGAKFLVAGAAIGGGLALVARHFAQMGDEINKASQRTGIAVEQMGALKYAAEQSGASMADIEKASRKLAKTIVDAGEGSATAAKALERLGVKLSDLQGLSPGKQFILIGDALSKMQNQSERTATAMELFGKSGTALLPLFNTGAKGVKALTDRYVELGLEMSGETAEAATRFGDILDDIGKQIRMVMFEFGGAIARALQPFAEKLTGILATAIFWVRANRDLVLAVGILAGALVTAGAALLTFGVAIKGTLALAGLMAPALKVSAAAILFLLNPITLVTAAIVALGAYMIGTKRWAVAFDYLADKFVELGEIFKTVSGGIADALAAGEITLAAKILWQGLKLAFVVGTADLVAEWAKFKSQIIQTGAATFYGLLEIYENVKASLLTAFAQTANFFVDTWQSAVQKVTGFFDRLSSSAAERGKQEIQDRVGKGQISQQTADFLKADIDRERNKLIGIRDQADQTAGAERRAALEKRILAIQAEQKAKLKEISDAEIGLASAAMANAGKEIADIETKRKELQRELEQLRADAAAKAPAGARAETRLVPDEDAADDIAAAQEQLSKAAIGALGTFNVAAIQGLQGGGNQQDRIANATEQTARYTKKIADSGGERFA